jgi:protein ImuB
MEFSKNQRRILALWFCQLQTDRLQRHRPAVPNALPLVVVEKIKGAMRIVAADAWATRLQLHAGLPLANARAMVPELEVVVADAAKDQELLTKLADWCDRFTPLVALDPPDGLLLDMTGTAHLFASEAEVLKRITAHLAKSKIVAQGAIAGTAIAARALAHQRDGTIVAEGGEAEVMAKLPIAALPLDAITAHAFRRAGLKTIGQAYGRKRSEIVSRFGATTLSILDEAMGNRASPITPRTPPPDYWQEQNFAEPIATDNVIRATIDDLTQRLAATMEQQGQGARRMEAVFFRADGQLRRIAIEMARPTRDAKVVDRLFQERLSALADPLDPGFGFDLIRLTAARVEQMESGVNSFDSDAQNESELAFLIDRLATRYGAENILRFQPVDTHIPELAWAATPAQSLAKTEMAWEMTRQKGEAPRRPLRLFHRPEPATLLLGGRQFYWRKVRHDVAKFEGPERIAAEWWRFDVTQPTRDYYRLEDEQGRRFWLYRDVGKEPPLWFVHGVFA